MSNANILWKHIGLERDVNVIAGLLVYNSESKCLTIDQQRLASNRPFYEVIDKWLRDEQTNGLYSHELLVWQVQSESMRGRDFAKLVVTIIDVDPANERKGLCAGLRLDCLAPAPQLEAVTFKNKSDVAAALADVVPLDRNHPDYKFIMDSRAYVFAAMLRAVAARIIDAVKS